MMVLIFLIGIFFLIFVRRLHFYTVIDNVVATLNSCNMQIAAIQSTD